ncbi:hypothetical protein [Thermoflexus sp.]|uniref:hypothetical protein n=1 Tax=Thermoflexus sp. TaxID=1969742 RepID=UPI0035E4545C
MRRLGIGLLITLVLACSAGAVALVWTAAHWASRPALPTPPFSPPPVSTPIVPLPDTTPLPSVSTPLSPPGTTVPSLKVFDEIARVVEQIRGLQATGPYTRSLMTPAELRAYQERKFEKDYTPEEARQDTLTLAAFDLLPRDFNLREFLLDLYTEQIAGFYDPDTKQFFVISEQEQPGILEQVTFAHEYTHLLQDQHFDLVALGFTDDPSKRPKDLDDDAMLARRALVEGDATLTQLLYLSRLPRTAQQEWLEAVQRQPSEVFDRAPRVIREELTFPYEAGFAFVRTLYDQGGWDAINAAFRDPPASTEQILHPEKFRSREPPIRVTLPPLTDTLGSGWRLIDENVLGEFFLRVYLEERLPASQAEKAAAGWGGDRYAVYGNEATGQDLLVLAVAWDNEAEAREFVEAYRAYAAARYGEGPVRETAGQALWIGKDVLWLEWKGADTLILRGPSEEVAARVRTRIPWPR